MGFLDEQRLSLEDAFFLKHDRILLMKMKEMAKMEETQKVLSEVSGITNKAILAKLVELNVRPETLASVAIVPLVAVAWADGKVDDKERKAVLNGANVSGVKKGSPDFELLEEWLCRKPGPELLMAWEYYIKGICEKLSKEESAAFKRELMDRAWVVAEASGGFLGLTSKVSAEERHVLELMEKAFK